MNKIYKFILPAVAAFAMCACEDDNDIYVYHDVVPDDNIPNLVAGSFPRGTIDAQIGDVVEFEPQVTNPEGVTALWQINGTEVTPQPTQDGIGKYSFDVSTYCNAEVKLTLTKGSYSSQVSAFVKSLPDMTKGFVVAGDNTVGFYDKDSDVFYPNVYSDLNQGSTLPTGTLNFTKFGGNIYAMLRTSTSNVDHLWVIDGTDFSNKGTYVVGANIGPVSHLKDNFGIITYSYGIYRYNLNTNETVLVERNSNAEVPYSSIVSGGKLIYSCVANASTNKKVRYHLVDQMIAASAQELDGTAVEIDVIQNYVYNFVSDGQGNIYTIGYDTPDYYLAKISPDMSVERVPIAFTPIDQRAYTFDAKSLAASPDGTTIYISAADGSVYRYMIGDASSLSAALIPADGDGHAISGQIVCEAASGDIYVPYYKTGSGKIVVFTSSGAQKAVLPCGEIKPRNIYL